MTYIALVLTAPAVLVALGFLVSWELRARRQAKATPDQVAELVRRAGPRAFGVVVALEMVQDALPEDMRDDILSNGRALTEDLRDLDVLTRPRD
ncbi:MAG: hypothetical protein AAGH15_11020 [Myxococcota bacterium]